MYIFANRAEIDLNGINGIGSLCKPESGLQFARFGPSKTRSAEMNLHDVFICHASEDKDDFVRPLAEALRSHHIDVWYDEFTLTVGDSLREAIDRGLATSRFAIVVLSPSFFKKRWPKRELNGLVARETGEDRNLILPVWHRVSRSDVLGFSPPLADLLAVSSARGMKQVVNDLLKKIRPAESPLIVVRDFLIEKGVPPPVITDEWWLDIVETKEAEFAWPNLNHDWRWIFPLPFPGSRGRERGLNIGWTALQLDWAADAKERKICQLTHPEEVRAFMTEWPGLEELARLNPAILALYAPQLTIPGFDAGYADVFDELLPPEQIDKTDAFRYGRPSTIDKKEPLCGDFIAWRHPTYGNYTPGELSYEFVSAHDGLYSRRVFNGFECIVWLLSSASEWMPQKLRQVLVQGFKNRTHWWMTDVFQNDDTLREAVFPKRPSALRYTKAIKAALVNRVDQALREVGTSDDATCVTAKFIKAQFFEANHAEMKRMERQRRRK
ncbi:MAG TPA: toll/interleukin-1 receptor domain-containing protein [Rhizomicrobium sp.]|nr:toll/interleukin-1 receptor domain-containing protein [Rhizomicrobium sp.]